MLVSDRDEHVHEVYIHLQGRGGFRGPLLTALTLRGLNWFRSWKSFLRPHTADSNHENCRKKTASGFFHSDRCKVTEIIQLHAVHLDAAQMAGLPATQDSARCIS